MLGEKTNLESRLIKQAESEKINRFVVGAVILENDSVLVLTRKDDDFMGGLNELPSGQVESGENLKDALKREIKEETGLNVLGIEKYINYFDYKSKSGKKTRQFNFLVKVEKGNVKIDIKEHKKYMWIPLSQKDNFNISKKIKIVLDAL